MIDISGAWRVWRGEQAHGQDPSLDDSGWRLIDLPHDLAIEDLDGTESPFSTTLSGGGPSTGWTVGGEAWYRKQLDLHPGDGQKILIRLGAAYMNTDVWLNGVHLAHHPNGYTPIDLDLGDAWNSGGPNVLAVRVKNLGSNSRWYSGFGLFRRVHARLVAPNYVPFDGLFIWTESMHGGTAVLRATLEIEGEPCQATVRVLDARGKSVTSHCVLPGGKGLVTFALTVPDPHLWSPESPYLYEVVAELDGSEATRAAIGIRTVSVDPDRGFLLNGTPIKLKGGCLHHDLGILGSAAFDSAEDRRVRLLRDAGFNAIRTAHNPPSEEFLEACDRRGMLVMDEAFDEWHLHKTPDSYAASFEDWCERDLTAFVRRDRNHPCVVMWSIGNEIPDSFDRPDTAQRLRECALRSDPTRPITAGICPPWWKTDTWKDWENSSDSAFLHLDTCGYNYIWQNYEPDRARHPKRTIMGTESYPAEAFENWSLVEKYPWVLGDFVWTAMDYIGESGIGQILKESDGNWDGAFPYHLAWCGDLDLVGDRKPFSYYREALWRPGVLRLAVERPLAPDESLISEGWKYKWGWTPMESHWMWPGQEGKTMTVHVFSSADEVVLKLNGREVGRSQTTRAEKNRAMFEVAYEPGVLEVLGSNGEHHRLTTAGEAVAIELRAEPPSQGLRDDLRFVHVQLADASGNPVAHQDLPIEATAEGSCKLLALGNADPKDVGSLQSGASRTWNGRALAVVQVLGAGSAIVVRCEGASVRLSLG